MSPTMSRHKLVKALDLDEELDDFQGDAEPDYGDEVSAEDRGTYLNDAENALSGASLLIID